MGSRRFSYRNESLEGVATPGEQQKMLMKSAGNWTVETTMWMRKDAPQVTYTGSMTSPANGKECKMKEIYTIIDDNNEKMEMYGPDSRTGEQYKTMEIKLTRKK